MPKVKTSISKQTPTCYIKFALWQNLKIFSVWLLVNSTDWTSSFLVIKMKPLEKNMQLCSKYRVAQSRLTLSDREYFTQQKKDEMKYTIKHAVEAHLMFILIKNVHLVGNKWCLLLHQIYLQSKQFTMYLLLLINKILKVASFNCNALS